MNDDVLRACKNHAHIITFNDMTSLIPVQYDWRKNIVSNFRADDLEVMWE